MRPDNVIAALLITCPEAVKLIKDRHHRELSLAAERKRYAQLVHEETRLRDRAEAGELKIKLELDELKSERSSANSRRQKMRARFWPTSTVTVIGLLSFNQCKHKVSHI